MRKSIATVMVLVSLGVVLGLRTVPSSAQTTGTTISLLQRVTAISYLPKVKRGPRVGDRQIFVGDLYELKADNTAGEKLGRSAVIATIVSVDRAAQQIEALGLATYILPGGKITTAQTLLYFSEDDFTAAITGGTGDYDTAQGEVELKDIPTSATDGIVIIKLS